MKSKANVAADRVTDTALKAAMELVRTASRTAARLAKTASATAANLAAHEVVCAKNNAIIRSDIKNLKAIVLWGGGLAVGGVGVLIVALAAVAWAFVKKELHLP